MADTRYITHDKWSGLTATQVTFPNGRQVASGYDALYRRNGVTETSGGSSIAQWQFFGNRTATVVLGNGITCSMMNNAQTNSAVEAGVPNPVWGDKTTDRLGYDGSGRLIAKRFLPPSSTTSLVGFTAEYDPSSNKRYERALNAESRSSVYPSYDSIDRLREYQRGVLATGGASVTTPITLPGTDSQRSYDLDSLGNWNNTVFTPEGTITPSTEIRRHNRLNEVTQVASTPVLYDHGNNAANPNPLIAQRGNGNITDDGTRIYVYDALNRLTTVKRKSDNAQIAGYRYDALGRRVLKVATNGGVSTTIANATYRYIYDGQQVAEELLFSGGSYSTLRQFVWGQYIDELVQLKVPTTTTTPPLTAGTYYPLQDLVYRTTATTNSSGVIVEAYDYDAYGNTLMFKAAGTGGDWWADDAVTTHQPMCEFLFTGRQYDPETQIYWYRARYYQPELGRFDDRIIRTDGSNSYEYASSDPTILVHNPIGYLYSSTIAQFPAGQTGTHLPLAFVPDPDLARGLGIRAETDCDLTTGHAETRVYIHSRCKQDEDCLFNKHEAAHRKNIESCCVAYRRCVDRHGLAFCEPVWMQYHDGIRVYSECTAYRAGYDCRKNFMLGGCGTCPFFGLLSLIFGGTLSKDCCDILRLHRAQDEANIDKFCNSNDNKCIPCPFTPTGDVR